MVFEIFADFQNTNTMPRSTHTTACRLWLLATFQLSNVDENKFFSTNLRLGISNLVNERGKISRWLKKDGWLQFCDTIVKNI